MTPERGLLDTSVAVVLGSIDPARLPASSAISSLSLAELSAGPHGAGDSRERARRQENLQKIESAIEALPFDSACARAYGHVYAALVGAGRKPHGPRIVDLMIASTALAYRIPLYTLNAADLRGLGRLIEIVDLG